MPKMVRDGRLGAMDVSMKARRWMLSQSDLDDPGWSAMIQENTVFGHLAHEKRLNCQDSSKMVASLELARWPCWLVMTFFLKNVPANTKQFVMGCFSRCGTLKRVCWCTRASTRMLCWTKVADGPDVSKHLVSLVVKCPSGHFLPMSCAYVTSGRTIWSMGMASLCGLMAIPLVGLGILLFC